MFFALKKNLIENSLQSGYVLILLSSILYSLAHVIAKPLLDNNGNNKSHLTISSIFENTIPKELNEIGLFFSILDNADVVNPVVLSVMVYLINALFFTLIITKRKKKKNNHPHHNSTTISQSITQTNSKNMLLLSLIGIVEVLALVVYYFGLKDSSAINASIFSNSETLFSFLIVMIVFRERLHKNELMPFAMIVFGIIMFPLGYGFFVENQMSLSEMIMGDFLILLSGMLYAVDICLCKYVSDKIDSKRFVQITSLSSGMFALLIIVLFQIPFSIILGQIPIIVILSVVGTGFATLFFIMGLRVLGGIRTIVLYSTTAVFGIIFSSTILFEEITIVDVSSIVFTISGIYFLRKKLGKNEENKNNSDSQHHYTNQRRKIFKI